MSRRLGQATPVMGVVVAVTAIVLVASVLQNLFAERNAPASPAHRSSASASAVPSVIDVDLGEVSSPSLFRGCLGAGFAARSADVEVLYGVEQRRGAASNPVFVLRNRAGVLRLCDHAGADRPSQSPLPTLSHQRPIAYLSNGQSTWDCVNDSRVLRRFSMTAWLLASPEVGSVQQRYFVSGRPSRWFTTRPQSGFAHLQSWLTGPQPAGTTYAVQYRVLDAHGAVIPQRVLPASQPLPGCATGSSVEID